MPRRVLVAALLMSTTIGVVQTANQPVRFTKGMVVSQSEIASRVGADVLKDGGTAVDAAVATAFALAVTHPTAGNIGGGGFMVFRPSAGEPEAYDFREVAPAKASPTMFMKDGKYDFTTHHLSHISVGVPGTVAGLHMAWKEHGKLPWLRLVGPAIKLAREGFPVSVDLAGSLAGELERMKPYPASIKQFSKNGVPYQAGETLKQPELATTLERIAENGPAGFYEGEVALLLEKEMSAHGGLITREDLKNYKAQKRVPLRGTYRGYDIIGMPPVSSGGMALIQMLNVLEGYDMKAAGAGSARSLHLMAEAMRRAFADRARYMGDPAFVKDMPIDRLISKDYASQQRKTIREDRASTSTPTSFEWTADHPETTHFSVVDGERNAVSVTYTLEFGYGSAITVPGAGFLLNNEMGDFNGAPGLTTAEGLIGTDPNLALPGKRMLSSMTPSILAKDGKLFMVTGSPGGRTIINTVLNTIVNVIDFGMNAQDAVDAGRIHHQWLPDVISYERNKFSPDTIGLLQKLGHQLKEGGGQGVAEVIVVDPKTNVLEGGVDRRAADGGAAGR
ncbi:MAG: gamma-glutamyltransferase [Vicinamibacterales bacterium]